MVKFLLLGEKIYLRTREEEEKTTGRRIEKGRVEGETRRRKPTKVKKINLKKNKTKQNELNKTFLCFVLIMLMI